ncbi:MAG: hypothetical protein K0R92_3589 [Lachnospiraceae bacterium]|nr:hypothetical protein [Lachnospiraceae bacterium]
MKLLEVVKERWKFYLVVYLLGYIISLIATGVPNIVYIIPVKLSALGLAILGGNAFYHASKGMPVYHFPIKGFKYILIITVIMIAFKLVKIGMLQLGVDLTPMLGFSK